MNIDQTWDYPAMQACAAKLDELRDASRRNKQIMDRAFELLASGVQAEVGKAFLAAYSEHTASIQLFEEAISAESELLRSNVNVMQQADEELAAQIRAMFGV